MKIIVTSQYKKGRKRVAKGEYAPLANGLLTEFLGYLERREPLPQRYNDHALKGQIYRDVHLKPDLVVIYAVVRASLPDDDAVKLAAIGTHSQLGL